MNVQSIQLVKVIITGHDHNRPLGIECLHGPVQGVGFKIFDIEAHPLDEHLAKCDVIVSINGTDVKNYSFEEFASLMLAARQTEQIELVVQKGWEIFIRIDATAVGGDYSTKHGCTLKKHNAKEKSRIRKK